VANEYTRAPEHGSVELPAATPWPLVTAFGVTLLFGGLVTSAIVSVVGIVAFVAGAVGWWRDVLPHEKHERAPLRPPALRARPIVPAPQAVEHLVVGQGHRVRLPVEVHPYSAGVKGGVVGGMALALTACLYGLIAYGSLWYPINLLAAAVVPSLARADTAQLVAFSGSGLLWAAIIHGVMSCFVGLLYGVLLPMVPRHAFLAGGILGPLLWSALAWASLAAVNPVLNDRIDWLWFVASQFAYGLTAGFVVARSQRIETMQTWPLAVRAGLETTAVRPEREER